MILQAVSIKWKGHVEKRENNNSVHLKSCDLTLIVSHQQLNSFLFVQCCLGDCAELRNSRTDELDVCTDSSTLGVSDTVTFLPSSPLPT